MQDAVLRRAQDCPSCSQMAPHRHGFALLRGIKEPRQIKRVEPAHLSTPPNVSDSGTGAVPNDAVGSFIYTPSISRARRHWRRKPR